MQHPGRRPTRSNRGKRPARNPDALHDAAVGTRHVLQTVVRADNPKAACNLTIAVTEENLFAAQDAMSVQRYP